jgi:glucose-1-phosphatase
VSGGVVVMDIGEVLVRTVPAGHVTALAELVGSTPAEVEARVDAAGLPAAFDVGELGEDDFVAAVRRVLERPGLSRDGVERAWGALIGPVDPVLASVAARFAAAGRLVLASNTDPFHWRVIRKLLAGAGIECPAHLSFRVGAKKPDAAFYTAVSTGPPPIAAGSWFIDDRPDNVAAASSHGLRGWLHRDPAATAAHLAGLL